MKKIEVDWKEVHREWKRMFWILSLIALFVIIFLIVPNVVKIIIIVTVFGGSMLALFNFTLIDAVLKSFRKDEDE